MSEVIEKHFRLREKRNILICMRKESLVTPGTPMESGIEYPGGESWNDAVINYGEPEGCDQFREEKEWVRYRGPAWWEPAWWEPEDNLIYDATNRWWETTSGWNIVLAKEDMWNSTGWFKIRVGFITPAQILLRVLDNGYNNLIGPVEQSSNSLLINPGQVYQVRGTALGAIGLLFETNYAVITDLEFNFIPVGP